MAVDIAAMRKLFKDGVLKEAIVAPEALLPNGEASWVLTVVRTDGSREWREYMTLARSDERKIYKSLDSVHADARKVGFMEVRTLVA
ncbi:plasmid replication protein RepB (plasmid) [Pseudomonas sp. G.S.17]|jgi:hypothetical protein|uniref:plasmid replication protein RepB n=1 Tax=Pseudomonas sp. G.S.17 TaxID=3137451 RepID=UPI00311C9021